MLLEHEGRRPVIHPDATIAATAVLAGEVTIGAGSCVLFGAVLTDDGGPVIVGEESVVMEGAVVRGTRRHAARIGDHVLVGPHAAITGAVLEDEVFVATGAMVFNGAVLERTSSVALGAAVHIGTRLPPGTRVPIGWVAVGDPATLHPPEEVEAIRAGIEDAGGFIPYVFGTDPGLDRGEAMRRALARYTRSLAGHAHDRLLGDDS